VELQAHDGVGTERVGTAPECVEGFASQLLGIAQKLCGRQPDEHSEVAKRRAQAVSRARRGSGNVTEISNRTISGGFVERNDIVSCNHLERRSAGSAAWGPGVNSSNHKGGMPEGSPSVLIIRLDAIGDALALTPMLAALRARSIPVDVLLRPRNAGVFAQRAVRREIVCDTFDGLGDELRAQRYSHVLVATEDWAGYRLALATGAPTRVGFTNLFGKPLKSLWTRRFVTRRVYRSAGLDRTAPHECEVLFRLGSVLLERDSPPRDAAVLRPMVLDAEVIAHDPRIALQVTNKWERLGIALSDVVELVRRLQSFGDVRSLAAANESEYAQKVAAASGISVEFFERTAPWKEAIAGAAALVAPDSGAVHLAGMVGTPVVALFPPSRDFSLQVARWAPWAAPHRIVRTDGGWPVRATDALAQLL
jgi:ADP-heptose:LPS heptosyltransferase